MKVKRSRYERKFRIEHLPLEAVHQVVRLLPLSMRPLFASRQITNIYFDTPNLDTYHENAFGVGQRKKFRLRWYGETAWPSGKATFEIKKRYLERGEKSSIKMDLSGPENFQQLLQKIRAIEEVPSCLQPVLMNSYSRSYYGIPKRNFRLTIDSGLRFRGLFFQHHQRNVDRPVSWTPDPAIILEVKYDAHWDDLIDPIMQNFPFRHTKNSKYVTGVQLLYER